MADINRRHGSIMDKARRLAITELTVIGAHCIGIGADGALFKFSGDGWIRLEAATPAGGIARRPIRYGGHKDMRAVPT